jgi:hypothetical protein
MAFDLAHAQAAYIERDRLVAETAAVFGNQLWLEARLAVAWHDDLQLAAAAQHRLAAVSVAVIARRLRPRWAGSPVR